MVHSDERQPPLWQQLQAAAGMVQQVLQGRSGTAALDAVPARLRAGVQALSFAVLRNLGRAQALREQLAKRAPPSATNALLCTALALLWDEDDAAYDAYTLVNQCVEAAKKTPATRSQSAFINACLRRFLRERVALIERTQADPVAYWNHPSWWIERLRTDWPLQWQAILMAANQHAPMVLRVNTRRASQAECLEQLRAAGLRASALGMQAILLQTATGVHRIPGFEQGLMSVQDGAAQLAAPLLLSAAPLAAGARVLDACAAPGGKTAHLLELAELDVTALDIDPLRCQRIGESLQRLGLQARVLAADAANVDQWWDGQPFDAILLDAPCSASGIVRRHPDIRWLRRPGDIDQLAATQRRLLSRLWPLLKPGGCLLYCTCSVFRAEGEQPVAAFLADHKDARLLPSPGHLLPHACTQAGTVMDNAPGDHDGFFFALLQKATG